MQIYVLPLGLGRLVLENLEPTFEYILNLYQKLSINSYKADMFRYLYLYKMGGFYHDHKMILMNYNSLIKYKINEIEIDDLPNLPKFLIFKLP